MSLDPEPESTIEPQDALDPQADESGPEDELGDAGTSKGGSDFVSPIQHL
jgi:hypothetical protein